MAKKVIQLIDRPMKRPFDDSVKSGLETLFAERKDELGFKLTPRWHKTDPRLLLESKFANLLIDFGPENLKVNAELSTVGRLMDNQKTRAQIVGIIDEIADAVQV